MEFLLNTLPSYDRHQHTISKWLAKLEQSFSIAEIEENVKKIRFCQVFICQTGEDILGQLPADNMWGNAKGELTTRFGDGLLRKRPRLL